MALESFRACQVPRDEATHERSRGEADALARRIERFHVC